MSKLTIHTIGHSNRSVEDLIKHLSTHDIKTLVDIRAFPRSRRHPHFNRATLGATLAAVNIHYQWHGDGLGGFRKPHRDSPHTALGDAAFRGFADYMDSAAFSAAANTLLKLAQDARIAIMCAEADYQHCHRQFIADYLSRQQIEVRHIGSDGTIRAHHYNGCLNLNGAAAVYNRHEQGDLFD